MTAETEKVHVFTVRVRSSPLTNEDKQEHPDVTSEHTIHALTARSAKAEALEEAAKWNSVRDIKMTHHVVSTFDQGERW